MRIVGGRFKGQRLTAPKGMGTRPTTDRTRESLFNILTNRLDFEAMRVADLFAGTGALGLESLSRGAGSCVFVENNSAATAALRDNVERLGVKDSARIIKRDAVKLQVIGEAGGFDLIFADPPYAKQFGERLAKSLLQTGWLNSDGIFVLEEAKSVFPEKLTGFDCMEQRDFGDTTIGLFNLA